MPSPEIQLRPYPDEEQLADYVAATRPGAPRSGRGIRADEAVRLAVRVIHARGVQPTPGKIQAALGRRVTHDLNGRDSTAYREEMERLGYVRRRVVGKSGGYGVMRWRPGDV